MFGCTYPILMLEFIPETQGCKVEISVLKGLVGAVKKNINIKCAMNSHLVLNTS